MTKDDDLIDVLGTLSRTARAELMQFLRPAVGGNGDGEPDMERLTMRILETIRIRRMLLLY